MKNQKLIIFLIAKFFSGLSSQFKTFAVPLLIYQSTGSVSMTGVAVLVEWFPRLIALPYAGVFCDLMGGRRIFLIADLIRMLACVFVYFFSSNANVLAFSACIAFFSAQAYVAFESGIPQIFTKEEIPKVQAHFQSFDQIANITGPALAAFLVSYMTMQQILLLASLGFLISFLAIFFFKAWPSAPNKKSKEKITLQSVSQEIWNAVLIIKNGPGLLILIVVSGVINLMAGILMGLSPDLIATFFHREIQFYGYLQSIGSISILIALAVLPFLLKKTKVAKLGIYAGTLILLSIGLLMGANDFFLFCLGFALFEGSTGVFNVYVRSQRIELIPPEDFGKTIGIFILMILAPLPLSGLIVATFAGYLSSKSLLVVTGMLIMILFASSLFKLNLFNRRLIVEQK